MRSAIRNGSIQYNMMFSVNTSNLTCNNISVTLLLFSYLFKEELRRVSAQTQGSAFGKASPPDHAPGGSNAPILDVDRNLRQGDRYEVILRKKENSFGINIAASLCAILSCFLSLLF